MNVLSGDQFPVLPVGVGIGDREVDVLIGWFIRKGKSDDLIVGNRLAGHLALAARAGLILV